MSNISKRRTRFCGHASPARSTPSQHERERLLKFGKVIGRAIEELMTIVSPATFYRWVRDEKNGKPKPKNPKGGQRKPREIRDAGHRDRQDHWLRLHPDHRRTAEARHQEDQPPDGAEHPEGRRHRAWPRSHDRQLGQLRRAARQDAVGRRLLLGEDGHGTRAEGHVCAGVAVHDDAGSDRVRIDAASQLRLGREAGRSVR